MPSSVLDIELGDTTAGLFDVLNVSGNASLAGTVNILQSGGYVARVGDRFGILNAASVSGTFGAVISPAVYRVTPVYGASFVSLNADSLTLFPDTLLSSIQSFAALPNAGLGLGAKNFLGTNNAAQTASFFNALLESAPTAAIGLDDGGLLIQQSSDEDF